MTLDTELAAAWSKEVMREHNPAFSIAVMRRIERALYLRALVMNIAVVSAVMLFFIIFAPVLTTVWRQSFAHFFDGLTLVFLLSALSVFLSKCLRLLS